MARPAKNSSLRGKREGARVMTGIILATNTEIKKGGEREREVRGDQQMYEGIEKKRRRDRCVVCHLHSYAHGG